MDLPRNESSVSFLSSMNNVSVDVFVPVCVRVGPCVCIVLNQTGVCVCVLVYLPSTFYLGLFSYYAHKRFNVSQSHMVFSDASNTWVNAPGWCVVPSAYLSGSDSAWVSPFE